MENSEAKFLLGELCGIAERFLQENAKFSQVISADMGGLDGLSIHIPQGQKGAAWHRARVDLAEFIGDIKAKFGL